jgi:hypothetical protein
MRDVAELQMKRAETSEVYVDSHAVVGRILRSEATCRGSNWEGLAIGWRLISPRHIQQEANNPINFTIVSDVQYLLVPTVWKDRDDAAHQLAGNGVEWRQKLMRWFDDRAHFRVVNIQDPCTTSS